MSCGSTPSPPRRAIAAAMRGPVTAFMFDATSGIVMPVPSSGASETLSLDPTSDRLGMRNTSEYVSSWWGLDQRSA